MQEEDIVEWKKEGLPIPWRFVSWPFCQGRQGQMNEGHLSYLPTSWGTKRAETGGLIHTTQDEKKSRNVVRTHGSMDTKRFELLLYIEQ